MTLLLFKRFSTPIPSTPTVENNTGETTHRDKTPLSEEDDKESIDKKAARLLKSAKNLRHFELALSHYEESQYTWSKLSREQQLCLQCISERRNVIAKSPTMLLTSSLAFLTSFGEYLNLLAVCVLETRFTIFNRQQEAKKYKYPLTLRLRVQELAKQLTDEHNLVANTLINRLTKWQIGKSESISQDVFFNTLIVLQQTATKKQLANLPFELDVGVKRWQQSHSWFVRNVRHIRLKSWYYKLIWLRNRLILECQANYLELLETHRRARNFCQQSLRTLNGWWHRELKNELTQFLEEISLQVTICGKSLLRQWLLNISQHWDNHTKTWEQFLPQYIQADILFVKAALADPANITEKLLDVLNNLLHYCGETTPKAGQEILTVILREFVAPAVTQPQGPGYTLLEKYLPDIAYGTVKPTIDQLITHLANAAAWQNGDQAINKLFRLMGVIEPSAQHTRQALHHWLPQILAQHWLSLSVNPMVFEHCLAFIKLPEMTSLLQFSQSITRPGEPAMQELIRQIQLLPNLQVLSAQNCLLLKNVFTFCQWLHHHLVSIEEYQAMAKSWLNHLADTLLKLLSINTFLLQQTELRLLCQALSQLDYLDQHLQLKLRALLETPQILPESLHITTSLLHTSESVGIAAGALPCNQPVQDSLSQQGSDLLGHKSIFSTEDRKTDRSYYDELRTALNRWVNELYQQHNQPNTSPADNASLLSLFAIFKPMAIYAYIQALEQHRITMQEQQTTLQIIKAVSTILTTKKSMVGENDQYNILEKLQLLEHVFSLIPIDDKRQKVRRYFDRVAITILCPTKDGFYANTHSSKPHSLAQNQARTTHLSVNKQYHSRPRANDFMPPITQVAGF